MAKNKQEKFTVSIKAAIGSRLSDEDAKKAYTVLQRLLKKNGGKFTPKQVLEAARNKRSPLHGLFDWDDSTAAEKWRVHQARILIASIKYDVKTSTIEFEQRAFERIVSSREELPLALPGPGYISIAAATNIPSFEQQLLEQAMKQLQLFKERYAKCSEVFTTLRPVFQAIDRIEKSVEEKLRSKAA